MARKRSMSARSELRKLFPSSRLDRMAREAGAVSRQRKVKIVALFWTLVLGFGLGSERTLAGLRRAYEKTTGQRIEESSFYRRFTPGLVKLLQQAAADGLRQSLGVSRALRGSLAGFCDVLMTDSTVIRLHDLLKNVFPACRTNHTQAALKAHAIISVTGAGKQSIKITSERKHDGPVFQVGPSVAGRLLLFDLGYFKFQLFSCITRNKGYFVSRLKGNVNPRIVAVHGKAKGLAIGDTLRDAVIGLRRPLVDVEVEVRFQRRAYQGTQSYATERFRVVGVRNAERGDYNFYITNVPPAKLAAGDIQTIYALRWQIELLFREWKSQYRLDDLPSRRRVVVEALVYASLLTLIVSRRLLAAVRAHATVDADRFKEQRWAALFAALAADLLLVVWLSPSEARPLQRRLLSTLVHEAPDPNVKRPGLLQQVEQRRHAYSPREAKNR